MTVMGDMDGGGMEFFVDDFQYLQHLFSTIMVQHAQGLVQPWVRGESWGGDARSIQRELTQKEVEDFLSQPDLWKNLLEPVRELESTLRAEAKSSQLQKKIFSAPEDTVPTPYRDLVEDYYRELSRGDRGNSRQ